MNILDKLANEMWELKEIPDWKCPCGNKNKWHFRNRESRIGSFAGIAIPCMKLRNKHDNAAFDELPAF
jgi:hypothetical protein